MTECPHPAGWLTAAGFAVSAVTVVSSYLIRITSRRGWVLSLWNQVPIAGINILVGAWPLLIINACFMWNAYRALADWPAPVSRS